MSHKGTATAQAQRSIQLATEQALFLQETYSTETIQSTSTAQAKREILNEGAGWQIIFSDSFSDNANEWPTGREDGDLTSISWNIKEGKYFWEAGAHDSFIYWTRPEIQILTDFHVDVEALQIFGPEDGQVGLIFRQTDSENYYLYRVSQEQYFALQRSSPEDWFTIIDWTSSQSVRPGDTNKLSVTAVGTMILLFINDHLIGEAYDDNLRAGHAGVAIGLMNPGDQAVIEFDNFEIRAPSTSIDIAPTP